jgi:hypothetical protein
MVVSKILFRLICILCFLSYQFFPVSSESFTFNDFKEFQSSKTKRPTLQVSAATIPEAIKPGERFTLHIQVILQPGSHIYSLEENFTEENLATQIKFEDSNLHPLSAWTETPPKLSLDPVLEKTVKIHESIAQFNRDYKTTIPFLSKTGEVSGKLIYRICDNRTCSLPLNSQFKVNLKFKNN